VAQLLWDWTHPGGVAIASVSPADEPPAAD
jgi:hypothetical protein